MKAFGSDDRLLDAEFDIEETAIGIDIVLHSNGGVSRGKPAYNPDYIAALEAILIRLGELAGSLEGAWVDSKALAHLNLDDRLIRFETGSYPVRLSDVPDIREFRLQIRRSVSRIGKTQGQTPGTGNKKLRLAISFDRPLPLSVVELALRGKLLSHQAFVDMLGAADGNVDQMPVLANVPDLRNSEVRKKIWSLTRGAKPIVKHRISRYVERGQIGAMVKTANGYRCQVCDALGQTWASFVKPDGAPYVEAHHVVLVSTLGDDVLGPQNVMSVCPNHHRQLHFGKVIVRDLGEEFEFHPDTRIRIRKFKNAD